MKTVILILFLLLCPLILGYGAETIFVTIEKALKPAKSAPVLTGSGRLCVAFPTGLVILLLIAAAANTLSVFLHFDIAKGTKLFAVLLIVILTLLYFALVISKVTGALKNLKKPDAVRKTAQKEPPALPDILLCVAAVLLTALAVFFVIRGVPDFSGDETLETVNSFIATGRIYSVDPLTGTAFQNGHPSRLDLMALPFFYTVLSRTFTVSPMILIGNIIPVWYLLAGLCLFRDLGDMFFPKKRDRVIFYLISVLLLICTDIAQGSAGYDAFRSGFAGINVLNLILVNLTVLFCLGRRWPAALITIITEPLIASTSFGIGACFFVTVALFIILRIPSVKRLVSEGAGGMRSASVVSGAVSADVVSPSGSDNTGSDNNAEKENGKGGSSGNA